MTAQSRYSTLALAFAGVVCLAPAAFAEGIHVPTGNLSEPTAARDFHHRLEAAARRFCLQQALNVELDRQAACRSAVRVEAISQLSVDQRHALASALGTEARLASARR